METKPVSIRLPDDSIKQLNAIAKSRFTPMRTILRGWIMERLEMEVEVSNREKLCDVPESETIYGIIPRSPHHAEVLKKMEHDQWLAAIGHCMIELTLAKTIMEQREAINRLRLLHQGHEGDDAILDEHIASLPNDKTQVTPAEQEAQS